jgi:hypothetical protein
MRAVPAASPAWMTVTKSDTDNRVESGPEPYLVGTQSLRAIIFAANARRLSATAAEIEHTSRSHA